jgi:serine/threonine-protein kinase
VDGRYRIVGLLGRGGMGEVYRADDLRLSQPVALKFLPDEFGRDPDRLAQFHEEVRTSRQVSHPNVCRMHDIGEVDGHPYLTMEYVDGEDLATSLRRIGRFPEDKALDIARQLAAGLAAAHERGIVHRDLKPANVMLDGAGKVRIMDFGLASAGESAFARAGTPAYMAPEQLRGQPATSKSDIFSLGLVLYELFTGRRAFTAETVDALVAQQEAGDLKAPSAIVTSMDPVVERAMLRCLDRDPARRPASALAVAASLPGGDPLAMALAAGETPSPEMVAAAGATTTPAIGAGQGVAWIAVVAIALALVASLADRHSLVGQVPMSVEPRALADRARQFEERLGAGREARDRASGLQGNGDILSWILSQEDGAVRRQILAGNRPSPIFAWYRSSPRLLAPTDDAQARPSPGNPPLTVTGMTWVALDMKGRLMEYGAVPPQVESLSPRAPSVDWKIFFEAAGLDQSLFRPITPDWTPRTFADDRQAWEGASPDLPGVTLRVEAASHRGAPVNFQIVGPWARPVRMQAPPVDRATQAVSLVASFVVLPLLVVGGALLARHNLRLGRGDRRGAVIFAAVLFVLDLATWMFGASHFADLTIEQSRLRAAAAQALWFSALLGLLYLAIEPHVRRIWPQLLITWSRLMRGAVRDPLLGRDLLVGAAAGVLMTLVTYAHYLVPDLAGWRPFRPSGIDWGALGDTGDRLAIVTSSLSGALRQAVTGGVGLVLIRRLVPQQWLTYAIATFAFAFLAAQGQIETGRIWLDLVFGAALVALVLGSIVRWGFVAGAVAFFVHFITLRVPVTLDSSRLHFEVGLVAALIAVGLAVAGFVLARRPSKHSL